MPPFIFFLLCVLCVSVVNLMVKLIMDDVIRLENIVKVYPPSVVAVDNVSVSFRKGEIHAVVGENGAGKSTLMKVLYGLVPRDGGEIYYQDRPVHFRQAGEAIAAGIGMVHQEILLIPNTPSGRTLCWGRNHPICGSGGHR